MSILGQPSQFRVPPSPSGSYCSGQYNISRSPRQPSPRSTNAEYQIGNSYARNDQGIPSNSPILSNSSYRRCSNSDSMESFMSMSPGANMSNPNDLMRNVPDASHNNNHDANRSAEKKEKKLEEDSLYDYIQTLPGQTQQLMQLHHVRCFFHLLSLSTRSSCIFACRISLKLFRRVCHLQLICPIFDSRLSKQMHFR